MNYESRWKAINLGSFVNKLQKILALELLKNERLKIEKLISHRIRKEQDKDSYRRFNK